MTNREYLTLKTQIKSIERAYRKGRISSDAYSSIIEGYDNQIQDYETDIKLKNESNLGTKVVNGHFVIELCCICGHRGNVTYGNMDFKLLGKDQEGFIYFECPKCDCHLQYDCVTRQVKTRKGILGLLFGRFSYMKSQIVNKCPLFMRLYEKIRI